MDKRLKNNATVCFVTGFLGLITGYWLFIAVAFICFGRYTQLMLRGE